MKSTQRPAKDGLNQKDFRPMEPKERFFTIEWDGIKFSGSLTPMSESTTNGTHTDFVVRIPGKKTMKLIVDEGNWRIPGAPIKFATALGECVKGHYR